MLTLISEFIVILGRLWLFHSLPSATFCCREGNREQIGCCERRPDFSWRTTSLRRWLHLVLPDVIEPQKEVIGPCGFKRSQHEPEPREEPEAESLEVPSSGPKPRSQQTLAERRASRLAAEPHKFLYVSSWIRTIACRLCCNNSLATNLRIDEWR